MIPLMLLDIDGTLIGSRGHVQDCVWQAVDRVRTAGMRLAVCTGRPGMGAARRIAERIGPNNPHIFQNGALIAYPQGEAVYVSALKDSVINTLIEHARDLSLVLELYTPTMLFVERRTVMSEGHARMIGVTDVVRDLADVAKNEPVVRAQWVITPDDMDQVREIDASMPDAKIGVATSPAMKGTVFVSVTQKGVSKGTATMRLADMLKVSPEDIMAVGDSLGDLPMLEAVGHPVAMGNATDELNVENKLTVGHVDECGVVEAFDTALTRSVA